MKRAFAIAGATLLVTATGASASGGLWCEAADGKVKIEVDSGMTRGMGSPLFNFRARIEIDDPAVTEDLRETTFAHATQYWLDGETLNLLVYREREGDKPHGYVEATLMTTYDDADGTYGGEYRVSVADEHTNDAEGNPLRYSGTVSCMVE